MCCGKPCEASANAATHGSGMAWPSASMFRSMASSASGWGREPKRMGCVTRDMPDAPSRGLASTCCVCSAPRASGVEIGCLAPCLFRAQRAGDGHEEIEPALQHGRVGDEAMDAQIALFLHRILCEFPPQLRLSRTGDADDQRDAAAWITRDAQAAQALVQRRQLFAPAGKVRRRIAFGAEFERCGGVSHDDSVASKATAATMRV